MNKKEIISLMVKNITDKVNYLEGLISSTRESNNDTKSSMGDKYETSREMLQQEINMLQRQLSEVRKQQEAIQKLIIKDNDKIVLGALTETTMGTFLIASSIGELHYKGIKITGISVKSPLAREMMGKGENENFSINNKTHLIKKVY